MTLIAHLKALLKRVAGTISTIFVKIKPKPKARYVRVAYGYPAYDLTWCEYEHDRFYDKWRRIRDDLFDEGRPDHFDIDMDIINFERHVTLDEKQYVLRVLRQNRQELIGSF